MLGILWYQSHWIVSLQGLSSNSKRFLMFSLFPENYYRSENEKYFINIMMIYNLCYENWFLYVHILFYYRYAFEAVGLTVVVVEKFSTFIPFLVIWNKWALTYFHDEIIKIGKSWNRFLTCPLYSKGKDWHSFHHMNAI